MTIEEDLINLFDKMADDPRFDIKAVDAHPKIIDLKSKIVLKDKALDVAREIIDNSYRLAAHYREQNEALEAELSARKGDSEVLMKIIEAAKGWDQDSIKSLRMICALIKDYLDAPEPPMEEEYYIIVDVNSVEDVKSIVEKIAKSVAALTGNHINARVQFVTPDDDMSPIDEKKEVIKQQNKEFDDLHFAFCRRGDTIDRIKNRMHLYEHGKLTQHAVICEINDILKERDDEKIPVKAAYLEMP